MPENCDHLDQFLRMQITIIKRHIHRHQWFQHIDNREKAIADFIEKYGWIMRETYCGFTCINRENCEIAKDFTPKGIRFRILEDGEN